MNSSFRMNWWLCRTDN